MLAEEASPCQPLSLTASQQWDQNGSEAMPTTDYVVLQLLPTSTKLALLQCPYQHKVNAMLLHACRPLLRVLPDQEHRALVGSTHLREIAAARRPRTEQALCRAQLLRWALRLRRSTAQRPQRTPQSVCVRGPPGTAAGPGSPGQRSGCPVRRLLPRAAARFQDCQQPPAHQVTCLVLHAP